MKIDVTNIGEPPPPPPTVAVGNVYRDKRGLIVMIIAENMGRFYTLRFSDDGIIHSTGRAIAASLHSLPFIGRAAVGPVTVEWVQR